MTKKLPSTYNSLFSMKFFHFVIFTKLVKVPDTGVKLVRMTIPPLPPQSCGHCGSPAHNFEWKTIKTIKNCQFDKLCEFVKNYWSYFAQFIPNYIGPVSSRMSYLLPPDHQEWLTFYGRYTSDNNTAKTIRDIRMI